MSVTEENILKVPIVQYLLKDPVQFQKEHRKIDAFALVTGLPLTIF